jgi:hypothetical protein
MVLHSWLGNAAHGGDFADFADVTDREGHEFSVTVRAVLRFSPPRPSAERGPVPEHWSGGEITMARLSTDPQRVRQ